VEERGGRRGTGRRGAAGARKRRNEIHVALRRRHSGKGGGAIGRERGRQESHTAVNEPPPALSALRTARYIGIYVSYVACVRTYVRTYVRNHVGSGSGDGGGAGALVVYTRASASKAPASRGSFLLLHFLLLLLSFPLRSLFSVIRFFLCSSPSSSFSSSFSSPCSSVSS